MRDRQRRGAGLALAVLAVLALSLTPLRLLCDLGHAQAAQTASAHQSGHGDGDSDRCCTNLDDKTLINSQLPDLSAETSAPLIVAVLASVLIWVVFLARRFRPVDLPPPPRSYYLRSARILR